MNLQLPPSENFNLKSVHKGFWLSIKSNVVKVTGPWLSEEVIRVVYIEV